MGKKERPVDAKQETQAREAWLQLWRDIGDRVLRLSPDLRAMLLEDFRTAIDSRLKVIE